MIHLSNGCKCSDFKVNPKNWESPKASIKKIWFIYYRFYDPIHPKGKLRIIKGMNITKDVVERQEMVRALMSMELNELQNKGFNPVTQTYQIDPATIYVIDPQTPFLEALRQSYAKGNYTSQTAMDIKTS